jgi:uncharacterized protein (TIGR02246 family)
MNTGDEQALRDIVTKLEAAWNRGDSVSWTNEFAEDADFIHILGGYFNGRIPIERGHRAIFDTIYKGSTAKLAVQKIRSVGPDAAIVFMLAELKITQAGLPPVLHARPTMIVQKLGGEWKIVAFQNTIITEEGAPARKDALADGTHSSLNAAIADHHPIKGFAKAPSSEKP